MTLSAAPASPKSPRQTRGAEPSRRPPLCDRIPRRPERQVAALPTLRQLQYLLALARHRSFSKAAAACCVTQSTLSGAIKELEAALGLRLVDRDRRTVTMTAAGLEAVTRAKRVLDEAESLLDWAHQGTEPLSGTLRLGIIPTIAPFLLPGVLPRLKERFPRLSLRLREETTGKLLDALKAGDLDLVLMAFPYDAPGLETEILVEDPLMLAEPASACAGQGPAGVEDIAGRPVLLLEDGHCLRDHALAACRLPSAKVEEFGATSLFTLTRMVEAGYGVTLLPKLAVDAGLCKDVRLAVRPLDSNAPARHLGLAWRRNAGRADDYRVLAGFLRDFALSSAPGIRESRDR